jgi:hypothetical protein
MQHQQVSAVVQVRYEDVAQDGRVTVHGMPHALGEVTWPAVMARPEAAVLAREGIVPILVRLQVTGTDAGVSAVRPLRGVGRVHHWTARSPDGSVDRIVLTMEVELYGRPGSTHGPYDPHAEEVLVGTVLADHVFTRPFAPPGQRRVVELPIGVPPEVGHLRRMEDLGAGGADPLPDAPVTFGVMHTDSNHHVNSLVYPRLFEEAAVRDQPGRPLARHYEIVWRKPFFAGDEARIRRWVAPGGLLAGAFVDRDGGERARIVLR